MNQDDDFWTTYIATTPEQDKDFRTGGFGVVVAWAVLAVIALASIETLIAKFLN